MGFHLLPLFTALFFTGLVTMMAVTTSTSQSTTNAQARAEYGATQALAFGDACMEYGQATSGALGAFSATQILSASPYAFPGANFNAGWTCLAQASAIPPARDLAAVFPGNAPGVLGAIMNDTVSDETWWTVSAFSGNGNYQITKVTNLATGNVMVLQTPVSVTLPAGSLANGTLIRLETVTQ